MRSRTALAVFTAAVAAQTGCGSGPPPAPAVPQRTTCGDVLSVALPAGYTCRPRATSAYTSAFVEGPRVRVVLIAAPNLAPGDSATDRAVRAGERPRPLSFGGPSATALVTDGGLWESHLEAFVPDVGNGGDRLVALARWQDAADERIATDIIASTRVMRTPGVPASAEGAPPPATAGPTPAPAAPVAAVPGGDPPGWLRHFAGFQVSLPAPPDMVATPSDPAQGPNVSLTGKTFEVHVYLTEDGVRALTAQSGDTVTSEPIVVDGPHGQLHRWQRTTPARPGRPFELELQSRLSTDVHLSVFASCQNAAACVTAETMLRAIRVIERP